MSDMKEQEERVLKFRLAPEYYPCRCIKCGLLASSRHFNYISYGDDGEVSCPVCCEGEKTLEMDNEGLWRRMLAQSLDVVESQAEQLTQTQQALDSAMLVNKELEKRLKVAQETQFKSDVAISELMGRLSMAQNLEAKAAIAAALKAIG